VVLEARPVGGGQASRRLGHRAQGHGDVLGQELGLVRCTSNVGTEVPILDDGQPLALP
jgi:hypothetical protein